MDLIRSSSRRVWSALAAVAVLGACASESEQPAVTSPDQANSANVLELTLTPGSMTFIQPTVDGPVPAPRRIIAFNQAALIPQTGIQLSPMRYNGGTGGWFNVSFVITGLSANIDGRIVPNNLPVGVYTGSFTVRVPGTRNSPVTVNVTYVKGIYFSDNAEVATGWTASGLWNLSALIPICNTSQGPCLPAPAEGTKAWWYGSPATGDFNFGDNSGDLTSPEFTIPLGAVDPVLGFQTAWETESCCTFDRKEVFFKETGSGTETFLGIMNGGTGNTMPNYLSAFLSMNSVKGKTGRLVFRFRTVDGIDNDLRGWIVDRIVVAEQAAFAGLGFPGTPNPGCTDCGGGYGYTISAEDAAAPVVQTEWTPPGVPRDRQ